MKKQHLYLLLIIILVSCGPKISKNSNTVIKEAAVYSDKIDANKALKEEITEGVLTDTEGFNDIGKFKFIVSFNDKTNELFKIKNIEITDKTITETYYFENNKLIYFYSFSENSKSKKIFLHNNKVVSTEGLVPEEQKLFINKSRRFQKAFNESH